MIFNFKPGNSIRLILNISICFLYLIHSPTTSIIETFNDFLLYFFKDMAEFITFFMVQHWKYVETRKIFFYILDLLCIYFILIRMQNLKKI